MSNCAECGKTIPQDRLKRGAVTCSNECVAVRKVKKERISRAKRKTTRACNWCKKQFVRTTHHKQACSTECSQKLEARAQRSFINMEEWPDTKFRAWALKTMPATRF